MPDVSPVPERKRVKFRGPHGPRKFAAHMLQFHSVCANQHCRRARQCRGAGVPCYDAIWWGLPEHRKCWLRGIIEALGRGERGLAVAKAGEASEQEQLAREAHFRAIAQQQSAPPPQPPREPPVRNDTPREPNCHTPRLTATTSRIAYKSVIFS